MDWAVAVANAASRAMTFCIPGAWSSLDDTLVQHIRRLGEDLRTLLLGEQWLEVLMEGWTVWWRECPLRDYAKVRDALREEVHRVREAQQTVEASIQYTAACFKQCLRFLRRKRQVSLYICMYTRR